MKTRKIIGVVVFVFAVVLAHAEDILPLEKLMPKFQVLSNAPQDFAIAVKAYNVTNWFVMTNKFESASAAESVIVRTKFELEIKYRVLKAWHDTLAEARKNLSKTNEVLK